MASLQLYPHSQAVSLWAFRLLSIMLNVPCFHTRRVLSDALDLPHPLQKEFCYQNKGIDAGQAEMLMTIKNIFFQYFMFFSKMLQKWYWGDKLTDTRFLCGNIVMDGDDGDFYHYYYFF